MTNKPNGYESLKELASEVGLNIPDLLALARNNDPFFCGSPAQVDKARWFADLWRDFNFSTGVHLRRVHYRLVSQHNPTMHDGARYENTENCWSYLCEAGKFARILGLVDANAFEDHRNPDPQMFLYERWAEEYPTHNIYLPDWELPKIDANLAWNLEFSPGEVGISGYGYEQWDQPYHVEVWVEKSTMDDVLRPICQQYGANLCTSLGFQSITSVVNLLKRIAKHGKPARIFYISDFDPAGDGMPTAVARQIEFWAQQFAPNADIKLTPLVLTREQVQQYRLPRIPVKDSDRRKGNFEERYGEGAVELDALEALHPGVLRAIVREAILPYRDLDLSDKLYRTRQAAERGARQDWDDLTWRERDELATIEDEAKTITERYRADLERLAAALASDLEPLAERLADVRQAIQAKIDSFDPSLPDRPQPVTNGHDEAGWLFDASRDYLDQIVVYQTRKNGHNLN